jgi:hypothetical protein
MCVCVCLCLCVCVFLNKFVSLTLGNISIFSDPNYSTSHSLFHCFTKAGNSIFEQISFKLKKKRLCLQDRLQLSLFCTSKEMVSELKRPSTEWEKTFASYTFDKELKTRIYRKLKKQNSLKK